MRGATIRERTRVTGILPAATAAVTRGAHRRAATSRPRSWSTAPASGPSRSARWRGDRAAALGRALLRRHRADRRRAPGPARAARPGRLHLLQGGGRRPGRRRLRAGRQAVGVARRAAVPVRVPAAGRGLGPLRRADGQRAAPDPGAGADRDQEVLQRPGELHPGQPVHPRRGAGAAELLRRRRLQLGRHRLGGRGRAGARPVDRRRRAGHRPDRGRHPPVRAVQRQHPLAARPGRRGARPALRDRAGRTGSWRRRGRSAARLPTTCCAEASACFGSKMGWERANFFAPAGQPPVIEYSWDKQNWHALVGRRAAWRPAQRVAVFDQTSFSKYLVTGPDAEAALQWLCTNDVAVAARPDRLHRHAQRPRHLRVRHHRDQAVARPSSCWSASAATTERDADHIRRRMPPGGRGQPRGRDLGLRGLRRDGPARRASCCPG